MIASNYIMVLLYPAIKTVCHQKTCYQKTDRPFPGSPLCYIMIGSLEINFSSIVCACEKFFHRSRIDRARIGAGACVTYSKFSDMSDLLFKLVLVDAELFQRLRDVEFRIELVDLLS